MNEDRSQQLIVGCLAAAGAIAAGNAIAEGHAPELRQLVGFSFVAVGLATGSMFAPGLAGSAAVLILTTSIFLYAGPLLDAVTGSTSGGTGRQVPETADHPHSTTTTRKA